jgi:hypothetical protein
LLRTDRILKTDYDKEVEDIMKWENMIRNISLGTLLVLLLFAGGVPAGAESEPQALKRQEVAGQREEELRLACLNEAEWSTRERNKKYRFREHNMAVHQPPTDETTRLKDLCRDMDALSEGAMWMGEEPARLARECQTEIAAGIEANRSPANVRHFENMKKICAAMTGKRVSTR